MNELTKKYLQKKLWIKVVIPLVTNPIMWIILGCMIVFMAFVTMLGGIPGSTATDGNGGLNQELVANVEAMQVEIENEYEIEYFPTAYIFAADNVARDNNYNNYDLYLDSPEDYSLLIVEGKEVEYTLVCESMEYTTSDCDMFNLAYEMWKKLYVDVTSIEGGGLLYPLKDPYVITAPFGDVESGVHDTPHNGVDFVAIEDKNVYSSTPGTVIYAYNECSNSGSIGSTCGGNGYGGYGNAVVVEYQDQENKFYILYAHMSEVIVETGDVVTPGQKIGVQGNSGSSTGEHLHFELRVNENSKEAAIDPMPYFTDNLLDEPTGETKELMQEAGIKEEDMKYVNYIVTKESNWDYRAVNPESGAYGLCQSLPPEKMEAAGDDWETNPVTQLKWCDSYATQRYGTWQAAYEYHVENNWW